MSSKSLFRIILSEIKEIYIFVNDFPVLGSFIKRIVLLIVEMIYVWERKSLNRFGI